MTEERQRTLESALRFATAYVRKAVADGLMEDCVVPASVALERLRAVLEGDGMMNVNQAIEVLLAGGNSVRVVDGDLYYTVNGKAHGSQQLIRLAEEKNRDELIEALTDALARALAGKPVRNADELLAQARAILGTTPDSGLSSEGRKGRSGQNTNIMAGEPDGNRRMHRYCMDRQIGANVRALNTTVL